MEKRYILGGRPVRVEIGVGLVRIVNDLPFRAAVVEQPEVTTTALVAGIKADYKVAVGRELAIRDEPFIVEIWGHLYFHYILLKYSKILKVIFIFGLYDKFCHSCVIIDCGENGKDHYQWIW